MGYFCWVIFVNLSLFLLAKFIRPICGLFLGLLNFGSLHIFGYLLWAHFCFAWAHSTIGIILIEHRFATRGELKIMEENEDREVVNETFCLSHC